MERFLKEYGGGSGGGVQSNWNQNDPTKPDYVKNRTHHEEIGQHTFEFKASDFAVNPLFDPLYSVIVEKTLEFIPENGSIVTVLIDGEKFEYPCLVNTVGMSCGNPTELFQGVNGACFHWAKEDGRWLALVLTKEPPTQSVSVSFSGVKIHKIERKYIPDNIANSVTLDLSYFTGGAVDKYTDFKTYYRYDGFAYDCYVCGSGIILPEVEKTCLATILEGAAIAYVYPGEGSCFECDYFRFSGSRSNANVEYRHMVFCETEEALADFVTNNGLSETKPTT